MQNLFVPTVASSRIAQADIWAAPATRFGLGDDRPTDDLRAALRTLQQRLGTTAERPGDFDEARAVAHALNNRIQIDYLRRLIGADSPAGSASRLVA